MPQSFTQTKFLGATIASFKVSAGWNEQTSKLDVLLYEDKSDPDNRDDFWLKEENVQNIQGKMIGTPVRFQFGDFIFDGLIESYDQENSTNANPGFTVTLTSPTKVLDAVQVIMSNYVGPVNDSSFNATAQSSLSFNISNIINVFGYLENGGNNFGNSDINETGLLWNGSNGIKEALETITNSFPTPNTVPEAYLNFGSYIVYRNHFYRLDLSNLPVPPDYYRIGGGVINWNLLELITQFCQDGGVDYIVTLTLADGIGPHTIGFKTVNRVIQPTLGQLSPFIRSRIGNDLNSANYGNELRSDITQTMLVGGEINTLTVLEQSNSSNPAIIPFWGFDVDGNPIIGVKSDTNPRSSYNLGPYYADDDLIMNLNASAVGDILASVGYGPSWTSSVLEMRCVLASYDCWAAYMRKYNPTMAYLLNIEGAVAPAPDAFSLGVNIGLFGQLTRMTILDLINDSTLFATHVSRMTSNLAATSVSPIAKSFIVYEFLKQYAATYYGKKFLILLPFSIQLKITDVGNIYTSYELADAGFTPEGSLPLGLNYVNENFFLDSTNRYYPFLRFNFLNTFYPFSIVGTLTEDGFISKRTVRANLNSEMNDSVVQFDPYEPASKIYTRFEQGSDFPVLQNGLLGGGSPILFVTLVGGRVVPAVVATIPNAIFAQQDDYLGNYIDVADIMNIDPAVMRYNLATKNISYPMSIHPPAIYPNGVAIALKSNQYVYGPWGKYRADGKANFEQDETLVPWNYGGYDLMNQAALAKIQNIPMGNQVLERSNINLAGAPTSNIGDALVTGGPVLTTISCSVDPQEGVKTQYIMETFVNRIGAFSRENANRLQRIGQSYQKLRRSIRQLVIANNTKASTVDSLVGAGMEQFAKYTYAMQVKSPHGTIVGNLVYDDIADAFIPNISTQTHYESVANIKVDNSEIFRSSACAGLESIFRSYTTDSENLYLPYYGNPPTGNLLPQNKITSIELNPLKNGSDILWALGIVSGQYAGLNAKKVDLNNVSVISLKGPIVINGWGYDLFGNPVPNSGNLMEVSSVLGSGSYGVSGLVPNLYGPVNSSNAEFYPGYLQKSVYWPTAPLDVRWDKFRSVWASPGMILCGVAVDNISPGGTGLFNIYTDNDKETNEKIVIKNFFTGANANINSGVRTVCAYDPYKNIWRPIAVDC